MEHVAGVLGVILVLALYFLPAIVATRRGIPSSAGVFVLNLFLGWTIVGWIVALVWAVSGTPRAEIEHRLRKQAIMIANAQNTAGA